MQMKHISDRLDTDKREKVGEILRFGIVGAIAALLQYGVYLVMLLFMSPGIANTIGYIISFISKPKWDEIEEYKAEEV